MGGCSSNPCPYGGDCCSNNPGTPDPNSTCSWCRMAGFQNKHSNQGPGGRPIYWKTRCWTADQYKDPDFDPFLMCGVNPGELPPTSILHLWCPLHPDASICKLPEVPACPTDMPWYLCWFYEWWALLRTAMGEIAGKGCDAINSILPDSLHWLSDPICWLANHINIAAILFGLGFAVIFIGPLIMDAYIIAAK